MIQYTVIIEDKDGNEATGTVETPRLLEEDQLVTVKNHRGTYTSGFILEIVKEKRDGSLR